MIETLSIHWDRVLDHLNRVSRLPTFRFHMREVLFWNQEFRFYFVFLTRSH